ncbi:universal stress protein [Prauserella flavalba]|uniref:Universal stress protein UspA n=1 Tax=Prauserella flavalba TaxID=1477506 RepID=A0A318LLV5_9PSEU|nr:universal stress protein [Prauserella flavalba]PXY35572.1 universal stress protein UspA [Prauserella flavalba]
MSIPELGSGPVVAGVDGSPAALRAVRWAADAAARHRVPLYLVHAAGYPDLYGGESIPPPAAFREDLRRQRWEFLHTARATAAETAPGLDVHTLFETDPPIPALIHASRSARMAVLGSSGHGGLYGLLVGSTTLALVSHAHCPVVSVRGDGPPLPASDDQRPVVVGIDGSPLSERAIGHAFDEACFRGVELVAVHTWSDADTEVFSEARMAFDWEPMRDAEERRLAERLAGWREHYPDVTVRRVLVKDRPRHELLEWSRRAQLVVVGSRGRGGFRGMLLGSTSQALIHNAECPVMIARPRQERG